ncbi:thiamine-phosphate pyrophosphorylase [Campylobacter geochelonis]|nr:thiamine-phosphate pyrophosphorylase [Campylobacter geochelonis]
MALQYLGKKSLMKKSHTIATNMKNQLYVLTDDFYTPEETIISQVREVLECGVKMVQFRSKKELKNERIADELIALCDKFGANLIINDDVNLALKLGAHGVHIGKDDGELKEARALLGDDKIIGVSCYNELNLALNAQENGASYVAFGAVFPTTTKKDTTSFNALNLVKFKEKLSIPTCLIGGINALNLASLLEYQADYLAIVSAAYKPLSTKENLLNLKKIIG